MKKILLKINNKDELIYPVKGYILGMDKYSILFEKTFSINEIKEIRNNNLNKEIFVSLNRPIFNNEIDDYRKALEQLDVLKLDGIIVGDVSALTYNLNTKLILDQLHLNNSYLTINHYYNNGCSGNVLTNDITHAEINEIKANTKSLLFKQVFGLPHLSTSVRSFISNYKEHANINYNDKYYFINEPKSDNFYHIIEDYYGTHILGNKVLNLLEYEDKINIDYMIIDMFLLNKKEEKLIIDSFNNNEVNNNEKINEIYDTDNGFVDKETIYKVKYDE